MGPGPGKKNAPTFWRAIFNPIFPTHQNRAKGGKGRGLTGKGKGENSFFYLDARFG